MNNEGTEGLQQLQQSCFMLTASLSHCDLWHSVEPALPCTPGTLRAAGRDAGMQGKVAALGICSSGGMQGCRDAALGGCSSGGMQLCRDAPPPSHTRAQPSCIPSPPKLL